ncbi:hypothetical protein QIH01_03960 [Brevibacillus brevis]|uniref:hypothetical protein n=1 Tax=Brevibacillus brevis TaxID=1393 RepID=UPI00115ACE63|nr:hypothetical protein [Lysinibacillus sp. SDF0063]TQR29226.1 hypothetical protein C7Y45_29140 [Lysinibacillus sp. SDF0063]WGV60293.1 hypothetical protein QIH01_03960 [Brevibacillus brevis]
MPMLIMYTYLGIGALFVFSAAFMIGKYLFHKQKPKLFVSGVWWEKWEQALKPDEDDKWEQLLSRAGRPFGWGKPEWVFLQLLTGSMVCILVLMWVVVSRVESFPLLSMCLASAGSYMLPYMGLKTWANHREDMLSTDIARFINRYVTLLENQVPIYNAMVKAARPTRKLKEYIPTLSEWNRDPNEALESFKRKIGVDDGIILVSSMRTIETLSEGQVSATMQRMEWAVDHRRMFRHRKKIKSLGIGYTVIVYPAFYMGLLVAMFPWYKLLTEILDKYLT